MDNYDNIKKRIINRKRQTLTDSHFNLFYNFMIKFMVIIVVCLSIASYIKVSPNMSQINTYLFNNDYLNHLFNREKVNVSKQVYYEHLHNNYYTNYSNEVLNIKEGRVVYIGEQELLGQYVTIMLHNNIEITYGNLIDVSVDLYDEVKTNESIGTYNDELMIVITQNDKEISYEELLMNND